MLRHRSLAAMFATALATSLIMAAPVLGNDPLDDDVAPGHQHGTNEDHLLGPGAWGKIELVGVAELYDATDPALGPGLIADVGVDPDGDYAYLANWGFPDCAGPESGGVNSPDAGIYVVDIRDPSNPVQINFIPTPQDTRPGEGVQVQDITTKFFSGEILAFNHEGCGKNYKGGFSLWDVSNPLKPKQLATGIGDRTVDGSRRQIRDANETHSVFIWDAGDRAYLVAQDEWESSDVDIFDITNPRHPVLVAEYDLNTFGVAQPELGLTDSFLHDMVVKEIDGQFYMLLSYWDGGWAILNVTDPANAVFVGDTDYPPVDPLLLESLGVSLTPEGNGHQAEFTIDNRFIIGTDEDFAPYRVDQLEITTGPNAGPYPSVIVSGGQPPSILPDLTLNGPVVYGGYGCPDSAAIPSPEDIPGYLDSLLPGEETILVLQRGPSGDPTAPEAACFPGEKAHQAALAGWDAVLFVQRHIADDVPFCGSGAFVDEIVAVCTTHEAFHLLFPDAPVSSTYPDGPAIGDIGEKISVGSLFDGWGYVHLIDNDPTSPTYLQSVDQYAIPEAHDPAYAFGFGDLTVHEVAVDPQDPSLAYLSYYAGGLRAIQIVCGDPDVASTCDLVEVGGYLDPAGNNFWGVQTFVGDDGFTYILASDRDSGLWIFKDP